VELAQLIKMNRIKFHLMGIDNQHQLTLVKDVVVSILYKLEYIMRGVKVGLMLSYFISLIVQLMLNLGCALLIHPFYN
jgi:hypothetical protein